MTRSLPRLEALFVLALALALAPTAAHATPQDGAPVQPEKAPDALAAAEAEAEHAALQKEYNAARSAYYKARRAWAAQPPAERGDAPVRAETTYVPKFMEAAERHAGTEGALPFLMSAVSMARTSDPETAKKALEKIVGQHVDSPDLTGLTFTLVYGHHSLGDAATEAMEVIAQRSPHDEVKSAMLYAQGSIVNRSRAATAEDRASAVKLLRRSVRLGGASRHAQLAASTIFELERLQVGMTAPDIEGKDLDGVAFKLSDYRGKVVVLDFWGDW